MKDSPEYERGVTGHLPSLPGRQTMGEGLERLLRGHFEISAARQVDKGESEHGEQRHQRVDCTACSEARTRFLWLGGWAGAERSEVRA